MKFTLSFVATIIFIVFLTGCTSNFVTVKNAQFEIKGSKYFFMGTNFWYGMNLGSVGAGGDRQRLLRELDALKRMGVNNLRIVAGSEGPDTEPYRMVPAMQTAPGKYNMDVVEGLDFLLDEMKKRNMYAVVCLADFWNWSGGFGQYITWSGAASSIPYPPPHPGGTWDRYQEFTAQFYTNQKAVEMLNNHIKFVVNRTNSISGVAYRNDPTIMAWELCNEPRGINNQEAYRTWIKNTAQLIKNLDANHLVTIGSEGTTSSAYAGTDPEKDHSYENIDYQTIHIWVQNWGIYDPNNPAGTLDSSITYMKDYINRHEAISKKIDKPLVLEEFGISRDLNNHDPNSKTVVRDQYYEEVFQTVYEKAASEKPVLAGVNFWAWGGEGRPEKPEAIWSAGNDFIGDPPHETQGWYSVYDLDSTTISVIKKYALKINNLSGNQK